MKIKKSSNDNGSIVPVKDKMEEEKPNQIKPKICFVEAKNNTLKSYKTNKEELLKLKARRMSNQYERKYPGSEEQHFVRERSVDSDSGIASAESALDTLKKLAKSMNNEQIGATEHITETLDNNQKRRNKYEWKVNYFSPSSLYRRNKDLLRPEDDQKKKLRAMIEAKVLRNVRNAIKDTEFVSAESVFKLAVNFSVATKKLAAFHPRKVAKNEEVFVHESEIMFRRAKPSVCQAKSSLQRLQDLATGWYCCYVTIRGDAAWEKVKPCSDGMRKKCEQFAPTAKNAPPRATEIFAEVNDICEAIINRVDVYNEPDLVEIEEEEISYWEAKVKK